VGFNSAFKGLNKISVGIAARLQAGATEVMVLLPVRKGIA